MACIFHLCLLQYYLEILFWCVIITLLVAFEISVGLYIKSQLLLPKSNFNRSLKLSTNFSKYGIL